MFLRGQFLDTEQGIRCRQQDTRDPIRERRRTEAILTAHGANAPAQRLTGLHATGGCSETVRERIRRQASAPSPG